MLTFDAARIQLGSFSLSADFDVDRGNFVAVIGPSGAGKSTLLNLVAGFVSAASGSVKIDDKTVTELSPSERPVSILFQDNNLFPHLTVWQNVALGLRPSLRLDEAERERVKLALKQVDLEQFFDRKPAALSGGQQSRVALARVLLRAQPLLLLDEPFSALGPALKTEMLELVSELATQNDATVLMVTHDPDDAVRFADQTIFVADGVANAPVATDDLFANPPDKLREYLGK